MILCFLPLSLSSFTSSFLLLFFFLPASSSSTAFVFLPFWSGWLEILMEECVCVCVCDVWMPVECVCVCVRCIVVGYQGSNLELSFKGERFPSCFIWSSLSE